MVLPVPHVSLEQWRCLVSVVEAGGYVQAAGLLHKSQSSVTYAVQKLENVLGLKVFTLEGRRSVLTPQGRLLYRHARQLLEDAASMERAAGRVSAGWESEISLAVEVLFPVWLLLDCLDDFARESPLTRIELHETVLQGGEELLRNGLVDLAILPRIPSGLNGEPLGMPLRHIPVAHPDHPLHRLGRTVTLRDLRKHRHLVVRDSGRNRDVRVGTVDVARRWTVSNMATSIGAVCRGYGFSWLPEEKIRHELGSGILKPLPLSGGQERLSQLYLIFPDGEVAGPGVQHLAELIRDCVTQARCRESDENDTASD